MISRRLSRPDYAEDPLGQFDYISNDDLSFGQAGQLEASLQVRFVLQCNQMHVPRVLCSPQNSCKACSACQTPSKPLHHRDLERVHAPSATQYRFPIFLSLLRSLFANLRPFLASIWTPPTAFCPSNDVRRRL
jgi:hypothetical protein